MAEIVLEAFLHVAGIAFYATGEFVLFVVTIGRHPLRWDLYTSERPVRFVLLSEFSTWIGVAVWLALAVGAHCMTSVWSAPA